MQRSSTYLDFPADADGTLGEAKNAEADAFSYYLCWSEGEPGLYYAFMLRRAEEGGLAGGGDGGPDGEAVDSLRIPDIQGCYRDFPGVWEGRDDTGTDQHVSTAGYVSEDEGETEGHPVRRR